MWKKNMGVALFKKGELKTDILYGCSGIQNIHKVIVLGQSCNNSKWLRKILIFELCLIFTESNLLLDVDSDITIKKPHFVFLQSVNVNAQRVTIAGSINYCV